MRRIEAEAKQLRDGGRWGADDTARLDEEFERAARGALRAPVLADRSLRLRRVAKALVPARCRPLARRGVAHLDALSRSMFSARAVRRSRGSESR
jgi:hypothetical protein